MDWGWGVVVSTTRLATRHEGSHNNLYYNMLICGLSVRKCLLIPDSPVCACDACPVPFAKSSVFVTFLAWAWLLESNHPASSFVDLHDVPFAQDLPDFHDKTHIWGAGIVHLKATHCTESHPWGWPPQYPGGNCWNRTIVHGAEKF